MKELLKENGIKIIAKEMWVWHDECEQDAELAFVVLEAKGEPFKYTVKTKDGYLLPFENASESNPNKKQNEESKPLFKVGDRVKIVKKVESNNQNNLFHWANEMDQTIGEEGIVELEFIGGLLVRLDAEESWYFLPESLELVDDSPKVGDIGYFYDAEVCHGYTVYGRLLRINEKEPFKYNAPNNADYRFFSKTPPEIK